MLAIQEMQYQVNDSTKDKFAFLRVGLLFLFAIFFVVGLRYIYSAPDKFDLKPQLSQVEVKQEESLPVAATPLTPTPNELVYKIKVINSTGVSGLALKTTQAIKAKGIKVEESLANGQNKNGTEIFFSQSLKDGDYLRSALKNIFPSAKVVDVKQSFDVVIDIGK